MSIEIRNIVFKFFAYLGLYVESFNDPKKFLYNIRKQTLIIKEYEIRKKADFIRLANNHIFYNNFLKSLVPNWNLDLKNAEFIGNGIGASSFNSFRKVIINEKVYFEKVYFNSFKELDKINWLQTNMLNKAHDIKIPKIEKIYKGEIVSIVYFEFLELNEIDNIEVDIIEISKKILNINIEKLKFDVDFYNYKNHFEYKRHIGTVKNELAIEGIDLLKFEDLASKSELKFTHGDIQKTNLFKGSVLIDWDSFGVFPIGFEQAFIYFRLVFDNFELKEPIQWLIDNFKDDLVKDDWLDFERNFTFYLYVFMTTIFIEDDRNDIKRILINYLKKY